MLFKIVYILLNEDEWIDATGLNESESVNKIERLEGLGLRARMKGLDECADDWMRGGWVDLIEKWKDMHE